MKLLIFSISMIMGLAYLSSNYGPMVSRRPSSIQRENTNIPHITSDSAPLQNLSEIRVPREKKPDFDRDLDYLESLEDRYSESRVAKSRVHAPAQRLAQQKYQSSQKRAHQEAGTAAAPHASSKSGVPMHMGKLSKRLEQRKRSRMGVENSKYRR